MTSLPRSSNYPGVLSKFPALLLLGKNQNHHAAFFLFFFFLLYYCSLFVHQDANKIITLALGQFIQMLMFIILASKLSLYDLQYYLNYESIVLLYLPLDGQRQQMHLLNLFFFQDLRLLIQKLGGVNKPSNDINNVPNNITLICNVLSNSIFFSPNCLINKMSIFC